ncbi:MAG: hypothetical protein ACTSR7_19600, partial [Promethearchaeota archaeon]
MKIKSKFRRFKKNWKSFDTWPTMLKVWAKVKLILKPTLLIIGLLFTFMPVYFEQESLMRVYNGIKIPNGFISIGLNFSDPTSVHINLPYEVDNKGFYDLRDISIKISLRLDYTHKYTDEKRSQLIISARGNQGFALVGEVFQDTYYKDFSDFEWSQINDYLSEVDEAKPVSVLMDVEFSFFLAGIEKDWIYISNINLTSDIESSQPSNLRSNLHVKTNPFFVINQSTFTLVLMIPFVTVLLLTLLRGREIKKGKPKSVNIRKLKKKPIDPIRRRNIFISLRKILIYSTIIVIWDIILLIEISNSSVFTSQYIINQYIAICSSFVLMVLMNVSSLLPLLKPLKFKKYSINEGIRSLFSSVFSFTILLVWSLTAIISYEFNNNFVIVRDTFPSFIPLIIVAGINIGIKILDLINYKVFFNDYRIIRIKDEKRSRTKPYAAVNKNEFLKLVLAAIQEINEVDDIATVSKIKSYFRQGRISPTTDFGSKVNHSYLNSLVDRNLLDTKRIKNKKKDEKDLLVYFTTINGEDPILNS